MRKTPALNRNVFFAGLVSLLMDISSKMIYPLVPLFLSSVLGSSKTVIGLIEGLSELTAGALKTYSGWLSDRLGRRKLLMVLGYGTSALSRPLLALSGAWTHVLSARFMDRTGKGLRGAPRDALIADSTAPGGLGRSFGLHRAMDTAGACVGPLIAAALLFFSNKNLRLVFWVSMVPAAISVIVIIIFIKDRRRPASSRQRPKLSARGLGRKYMVLIAATAVFSLGNSSDAFLVLKANSTGVSASLIPILYFLFNAAYAATSYPAGVLADRVGRKRVMTLGFLLFSLVYAGFANATEAFHCWALFALYGLFLGITEGVYRAYIAGIVPDDLRGTAFGIHSTVTGALMLPASLAGGLLWDAYGPHATFYLGSTSSALAAAVLVLLPEKPGG